MSQTESRIKRPMVESAVRATIKTLADMAKDITLPTDFPEVDLSESARLDYFITGLTLRIQAVDRGPAERIKESDISGAITAAIAGKDPVEYLRGRGYTEKLILRVLKK